MTKDEAIKAMRNGEKVTHYYFSSDEWITEKDGKFLFEDDCQCEFREFWVHRSDDYWLDRWSIYNSNQQKD